MVMYMATAAKSLWFFVCAVRDAHFLKMNFEPFINQVKTKTKRRLARHRLHLPLPRVVSYWCEIIVHLLFVYCVQYVDGQVWFLFVWVWHCFPSTSQMIATAGSCKRNQILSMQYPISLRLYLVIFAHCTPSVSVVITTSTYQHARYRWPISEGLHLLF